MDAEGEGEDGEPRQVYCDTVCSTPRKPPKRGFSRKVLLDDLIAKSFSEDVAVRAVDEYERVTGRRNYQDARRRGLLFGCVLRVYRDRGVLFDLRSVAEQMGVEPATTSRGVRLYCEHARRLGEHVDRLECEPIQYVRLLVGQLARVPERWCTAGFGAVEHTGEGELDVDHVCRCIEAVLRYLSRLDVASSTKSSTPRCVAAASIYFHFTARGCTISKESYASLVGCASVSVEKIHSDISNGLKALRTTLVLAS